MPNGAMGVELISNRPHNISHAEIVGFEGDTRIRLSVSSACSMKSSQRDIGHSGSMPAKIAMKCPFQVLIARSALLVRCCATGVSSSSITLLSNQVSILAEISLSIRTIFSGVAPRSLKNLIARCNAADKSDPERLLVVSTRIMLVSS